MPTPPDTDNGRMTLAVLGNDIAHIKKTLDDWMDGNELRDKVLVEHTVRLEQIAGLLSTQCQRLDGRIDGVASEASRGRAELDGKIARVSDKQEALSKLPETLTDVRIQMARIGATWGGLSGIGGGIITAAIMRALNL